jgi:hypothetical protein
MIRAAFPFGTRVGDVCRRIKNGRHHLYWISGAVFHLEDYTVLYMKGVDHYLMIEMTWLSWSK